MLVAEDVFHILWCDNVGQVIPFVVEPCAEVSGDLLGIYVILIRLVFLARVAFAGVL